MNDVSHSADETKELFLPSSILPQANDSRSSHPSSQINGMTMAKRRRPTALEPGTWLFPLALLQLAQSFSVARPKIPKIHGNLLADSLKISRSSSTTTLCEKRQLNGDLETHGSEIDDSEQSIGTTLLEAAEEKLGELYCAINLDDLTAPFMTSMDSESTFLEYTEDGACVPAGPVGQFKEDVANWLDQPIVEIAISVFVLFNSLLVAISTVDFMNPYLDTIRNMQNLVGIVFLLDFMGRWISSSEDTGRHVFNPQFPIDILVVIFPLLVGLTPTAFWADTWLPDWLTSPSGLFNLELLRVLRLRRVLKDIKTFEKFERALGVNSRVAVQEWQLQLARVLLSLFTLVSVSSGLIYTVEHDVNPGITNYFSALYFGLTTLTTVGFGDIAPVTSGGKLVVCGSIIVGVAVVPAQAAALVEALLARQAAKKVSSRKAQSIGDYDQLLQLNTSMKCPNCGSSFHWSSARFCYSCGKEI